MINSIGKVVNLRM